MTNLESCDTDIDGCTGLSAEAPSRAAQPGGGAHAQRLTELEHEIIEQRRQLTLAMQYLHEAAHLARYHQPALERHIRAFLDELGC